MRHTTKPQPLEGNGARSHQTKSLKSSSRKHAGSSRQLDQLFRLYDDAMDLFNQSALAASFEDMLNVKNRPRITRLVSLGLGSLLDSKDQQRRIKQLVIFMAIASHLTLPMADKGPLTLYAQDPTFTAIDEAFLNGLGITVLRTPSSSDLGDAGQMINEETLVYSPFLTIATYKLLFSQSLHTSTQSSSGSPKIPILVSDDFNALKLKWDKRTSEHRDVETLIKGAKSGNYRRRAVNGEGFWTESDRPFPLAIYWRQTVTQQKRGIERESCASVVSYPRENQAMSIQV
ncbi:SRR1 domain-containing protein [Fusarium falciforme]|uniref:SRR1 domain-containing protein n=1 Tax=Fusarium falciforme TaxID=195108 RepID=UPI002300F8F1|nr:SRR1 domain-containing protein [Fusarium falciforme]WAO95411.1 SRR1 domain-containing protein [Fusarium falciforme]